MNNMEKEEAAEILAELTAYLARKDHYDELREKVLDAHKKLDEGGLKLKERRDALADVVDPKHCPMELSLEDGTTYRIVRMSEDPHAMEITEVVQNNHKPAGDEAEGDDDQS